MTRNSWTAIYDRVVNKMLDEGYGTPGKPFNVVEARARADEIYYYLVDLGRQEAKDREPREPIPPGGDE